MTWKTKWTAACALVAVTAMPLLPDDDGDPGKFGQENDVIFELVGQVTNIPMTPTSLQFGYLSSIQGLEGIFSTSNPAAQNQTTALFTFFNDSVTQRVIAHGNLRIVNRVGTTKIYYDATPNGDFTVPGTFQDGMVVQTSSFRHQVILDAATGKFTTVFVNEVTSAEPFVFNGRRMRLGKSRDKYRILVSGQAAAVPGTFEIAGYAVAGSGKDD